MAITYEKVPRIFGQELPDHRNASAMAEYSELDLDSYLQTQVKSLLADSKPIDTSYYRKNVEDHLLFMSPDLAKQASYVDAFIYAINDF